MNKPLDPAATVKLVRSGEPDLTNRQMALLMLVYLTPGPHTVRGLAKVLGVSKPVVTRALNTLGALGYLRGRGVLITAVEPDSPADDAGIKRGMVLYGVNKSTISSVRQLDEVLRAAESGANVEFTIGILRARGENHELATLTLKAR